MSYKLTYYKTFKKPISKYRKSVPKALKDRLWDTTYGPEAGQGKCYVCGTTINSKQFEAGHVVSVYHGGETTLNNLKCICSTCNKSMGTQNLENFKKTYFPAIRNSLKNKTTCHCCCHDEHTRKDSHIEKISKKYKEIPDNILVNRLYPISKYHSDFDSEEEKEEEKEERKEKLLLMLDQYKYIPNKDK